MTDDLRCFCFGQEIDLGELKGTDSFTDKERAEYYCNRICRVCGAKGCVTGTDTCPRCDKLMSEYISWRDHIDIQNRKIGDKIAKLVTSMQSILPHSIIIDTGNIVKYDPEYSEDECNLSPMTIKEVQHILHEMESVEKDLDFHLRYRTGQENKIAELRKQIIPIPPTMTWMKQKIEEAKKCEKS